MRCPFRASLRSILRGGRRLLLEEPCAEAPGRRAHLPTPRAPCRSPSRAKGRSLRSTSGGSMRRPSEGALLRRVRASNPRRAERRRFCVAWPRALGRSAAGGAALAWSISWRPAPGSGPAEGGFVGLEGGELRTNTAAARTSSRVEEERASTTAAVFSAEAAASGVARASNCEQPRRRRATARR